MGVMRKKKLEWLQQRGMEPLPDASDDMARALRDLGHPVFQTKNNIFWSTRTGKADAFVLVTLARATSMGLQAVAERLHLRHTLAFKDDIVAELRAAANLDAPEETLADIAQQLVRSRG